MKRILLVVVFLLGSFFMLNCGTNVRGGDDYLYRSYKHSELHILKLAKQLEEIHRQLDWFLFDVDEEDPYNY